MQKSQRRTKIFNAFFIAIISSAIVAYIWQMNALATEGFVMRDLTQQASVLQENNKQLELEIDRLESLSLVLERVNQHSWEEVKKIEFLSNGSSQIAINK